MEHQRDQQPGVPEVHRHGVQREAQRLKELYEPDRRGESGRLTLLDEHSRVDHSVSSSPPSLFIKWRTPGGRDGLIVRR